MTVTVEVHIPCVFPCVSFPADSSQDILQQSLQGLSLSPEAGRHSSNGAVFRWKKTKNKKKSQLLTCKLYLFLFLKLLLTDPTNTAFQTVPEQKQLHCQPVIGGDALLGQQQYLATLEGAADVNAFPEQLEYPLKGAEGGACDEQLAEQFLQIMNQTNNGDRFSEFSVVLRQYVP